MSQKGNKMKKDIHPNYNKTVIKCVCGNEIETGSVEENITVEICNACHPFYTGNQKIQYNGSAQNKADNLQNHIWCNLNQHKNKRMQQCNCR